MPYLYRSFSAKEPCNQWLFCEKMTCNLRHPMGFRNPVYRVTALGVVKNGVACVVKNGVAIGD